MTGSIEMSGGRGNGWRVAMWGGAAGLLLVPAIAIQFTPQVRWGPEDFLAMGMMLLAVCVAFELAVKTFRTGMGRAMAGVAILGIFLMVWAELAVGIFD